jgi:hypothetical protein
MIPYSTENHIENPSKTGRMRYVARTGQKATGDRLNRFNSIVKVPFYYSDLGSGRTHLSNCELLLIASITNISKFQTLAKASTEM